MTDDCERNEGNGKIVYIYWTLYINIEIIVR